MSLLLRVNLALILVFAVVATLAGLGCRALLQRNAAQDIHAEAELMIDSVASGARATGPAPAPARADRPGPALPPDARMLLRLESELARYIGPVARHLVNRAAVRAGSLDELLALLGGEIEPESARRAFMSAARESLRARP